MLPSCFFSYHPGDEAPFTKGFIKVTFGTPSSSLSHSLTHPPYCPDHPSPESGVSPPLSNKAVKTHDWCVFLFLLFTIYKAHHACDSYPQLPLAHQQTIHSTSVIHGTLVETTALIIWS